MSLIEKATQQIQELKVEKDALILAHNYQRAEVQLIADKLGDSLALAREATKTDRGLIIFCGVDFMAESVKILNPEKKVLIPDNTATCPLANMVELKELVSLKHKYSDADVVGYVNTTAETKACSDICCTSANSIEVVRSLSKQKIIFLPDQNLGRWTKKWVGGKEIILWPGYCYVHKELISLGELQKLKTMHPNALVMAHPECNPEILELADKVTSTGGMVNFARESVAEEFVVATEQGLCSRLCRENPTKKFWEFPKAICKDMKKITLGKVFECLKEERNEVRIEPEILEKAKAPIERMMRITKMQ